MIPNIVNQFKRLLNQSLHFRIIFWSLISSISIAIVLTVTYSIVGCGIFGIPLSCQHYLTQNINQCSTDGVDYCCVNNYLYCGDDSGCLVKPTPFDVPKCFGLLVAAWILDLLTLGLMIAFVWLFNKLYNANLNGDYQHMNEGIEIAN